MRHQWSTTFSPDDHDTVYLIRSMCIPKMKKYPKIITVRKYKNFDQNVFLSELRGIKFDEIKNVTGNPNEMWLIWKTCFLDVLNKHAPVSDITIKGNSLSYITMEIRQMIRKRDYLRKMSNKTASPYLGRHFSKLETKLPTALRRLR